MLDKKKVGLESEILTKVASTSSAVIKAQVQDRGVFNKKEINLEFENGCVIRKVRTQIYRYIKKKTKKNSHKSGLGDDGPSTDGNEARK